MAEDNRQHDKQQQDRDIRKPGQGQRQDQDKRGEKQGDREGNEQERDREAKQKLQRDDDDVLQQNVSQHQQHRGAPQYGRSQRNRQQQNRH